ncbi:DUF5830 family protein [Sulfuricurvum sp.]|uniref:DUF5830 family protein n=1 Tax=Sulfuricurvum sp. TaxID=2025608 RepID=UPI0035626B8E
MINEATIKEAVASDPTQEITEGGNVVGENWNLRVNAFVEAHGKIVGSIVYNYLSDDEIYNKGKAAIEHGMIAGTDMYIGVIQEYAKQGYFHCMICGAHIHHHYWAKMNDGKYGAIGSECIDVITGTTIGELAQVAAGKAIRDTLARRKASAVKREFVRYYNALDDDEKNHVFVISDGINRSCPYITESQYKKTKETYHFRERAKFNETNIIEFCKEHSKCSEFMSSCVEHPTFGRIEAVKNCGCKTCGTKFKAPKFEAKPPEHFNVCDWLVARPINFKDIKIVQEVAEMKKCGTPCACIQEITCEKHMKWIADCIIGSDKSTTWKFKSAINDIKVLIEIGYLMPDFGKVEPDPMSDDEVKTLNAKVNKEIERATKMADKMKADFEAKKQKEEIEKKNYEAKFKTGGN